MNEKFLDIIDRFRDCDTGPEFYQSAEIDLPFNSFIVHGIGPVGLSISLNQVEALKGISAPAPFVAHLRNRRSFRETSRHREGRRNVWNDDCTNTSRRRILEI
jgi:hypothetical protein